MNPTTPEHYCGLTRTTPQTSVLLRSRLLRSAATSGAQHIAVCEDLGRRLGTRTEIRVDGTKWHFGTLSFPTRFTPFCSVEFSVLIFVLRQMLISIFSIFSIYSISIHFQPCTWMEGYPPFGPPSGRNASVKEKIKKNIKTRLHTQLSGSVRCPLYWTGGWVPMHMDGWTWMDMEEMELTFSH